MRLQKQLSRRGKQKDYAKWVVERIKSEKLQNIILVGHSFGGRIATEIASSSHEVA